MSQVLDISDMNFKITVLTKFKDKRHFKFQTKNWKHLNYSRFDKESNRYSKTELKMSLAVKLNPWYRRDY